MPPPSPATEEQLILYYLGLTPSGILTTPNTTSAISSLVSKLTARIHELTAIDEQEDSPNDKARKLKERETGFRYMAQVISDITGRSPIGSTANAAAVGKTRTLIDTIVEDVRSNPVVRIGRFRFGPGELGPTDVNISENYAAVNTSTLRSSTDATFRQPYSITKITVDLIFSGVAKINGMLRPMLAELYTSPITTIESPIILDSIVNQFSSPEIEQEIRERIIKSNKEVRSALNDLTRKAAASWASLREILATDDLVVEYMRQRIKHMVDDTKLYDIPASSTPSSDNLISLGISIPVTLLDVIVTTDPKATNTLHVRLSFLRHNSSAFGVTGLQFMDKDGNPTPDVDRCPWISKVADLNFLSGRNPHMTLGEYLPSESLTDFECEWKDKDNAKITRTFPSGKQTGTFVIESVQAAMNLGVATIPILGSKYPTVQIMGKSGVSAKVVLATTSKSILREFHLMKDHLDSTARTGMGFGRDERVTVRNSVLNLMGGKNFVITSVETSPYEGTSNAYSIELTLAPAEYAPGDQQRLILASTGVSASYLKQFWDYLYQKYQLFYTSPYVDLNKVALGAKDLDLSYETQLAVRLMFGTTANSRGIGANGILQGPLLVAGLTVYAARNKFGKTGTLSLSELQEAYNYVKGQIYDSDASDLTGSTGPFVKRVDSAGPRDYIEANKDLTISGGSLIDGLFSSSEVDRNITLLERGEFSITGKFYFKKEFWDAVWEAMITRFVAVPKQDGRPAWRDEPIRQIFSSLNSIFTTGDIAAFADFPLLKELIKTQPGKLRLDTADPKTGAIEQSLLSNYPDVALPTYKEIFSNPDGTIIQTREGPLWEKFAPSYYDLGIEPSMSETTLLSPKQARDKPARGLDDSVEPGFWLWDHGVKERIKAGLDESIREIPPETRAETNSLRQQDHVLSVEINTEELRFRDPSTANEQIRETIHSEILTKSNQGSRKFEEITKGKFNKVYEVIDSNGQKCALVEPAAGNRGEKFNIRIIDLGRPLYVNSTLGIAYDRQSGKNIRAVTESIVSRIKDNTYSHIRHYPAFRLYFVESDDNVGRENTEVLPAGSEVRLIDDLYTTNAVIDIKITHDKRDSSVAIVRILNTNGELDRDEFMTETEREKRGLGIDDEGEDYLRRMKMKIGTGIQIRMGYSSNPNDLDVVFTGQIAEIRPGAVLEMVAQSFKTEMYQETSIYEGNANARMVMHKLMTKMPLPHLGRVFNTDSISDAQFRRYAGITAEVNSTEGIFGVNGQRGIMAGIFGSRFSTTTRNIWFESNFDIHTPVGEFFRDVGEVVGNLTSIPFLDTSDHYWLFDRVTIWDAMEEICRHYPGHVCDVRPYGTEATFFFGLPDQPYMYRDQTASERFFYQKYLAYVQPAKLNKVAADLLSEFRVSQYGTTTSQDEIQWASFISRFATPESRRDKLHLNSGLELEGVKTAVLTSGLTAVWGSWSNFLRHISNFSDNWIRYNYTPFTTTLDFTAEWDRIASYSPELPRYLTAFFFGFKYEQWPGNLEGLWPDKFRAWMGPLTTYSDEVWDSSFLSDEDVQTSVGADFYERMSGSDSGLTGIRFGDVSGTVLNPAVGGVTGDAMSLANTPASSEYAWKLINASDTLAGLPLLSPTPSTELGNYLLNKFPYFRVFIYYFAQFLTTPAAAAPKAELQKGLADMAVNRIPPGFKPFRNYHYVNDHNDIISNDIEATTREMANTVVIKAPVEQVYFDEVDNTDGSSVTVLESDQEWVYFPNDRGISFHPDIDASNRILRMAEEPNANRRQAQANCLISQMAQAMRPMYRGQLKMVGRDVWPWDIVYISDSFNVMKGPVEVERVVHEFSRETGWVTTIEPHALIMTNSPVDKYQSSVVFEALSAVSLIADIFTVIGIGAAVKAAVVGGVGAARLVVSEAAKVAVDKAAKQGVVSSAIGAAKAAGKGIFSSPNLHAMLGGLGRAFFASQVVNEGLVVPAHQLISNVFFKMNFEGDLWPVDVIPLVYKGIPYYAGIPISDREVFTFWEAFSGSIRDFWKEVEKMFRSGSETTYYLPTGGR